MNEEKFNKAYGARKAIAEWEGMREEHAKILEQSEMRQEDLIITFVGSYDFLHVPSTVRAEVLDIILKAIEANIQKARKEFEAL
jgi:hypothetical protein